jgi:hypothetical protein
MSIEALIPDLIFRDSRWKFTVFYRSTLVFLFFLLLENTQYLFLFQAIGIHP